MAKTGSNIYKRKDGRYEGRIPKGESVRQQGYIYVYARTLRELRQKMEEARESRKQDGRFQQEDWEMEDAAGAWLEENRERWKPTTYAVYYRLVHGRILPALGKYRVAEITQPVFDCFEKELNGSSDGKSLSENYRKLICETVCRILDSAGKRTGLQLQIPRMPAGRREKGETELPDERELQRLEDYLTAHLEEDTCLGILLAACTGIRIGELCALQWGDIDLEGGFLRIRKNLQRVPVCDAPGPEEPGKSKTKISTQRPKTPRSQRTIPLPDGLLPLLRAHEKPEGEYLISGKKAPWAEVRTVQYRFSSILKKCGIRPFHFHLLRHAFASRCLDLGCDLKCLSEILGHSSVSTTMNLYIHPTMSRKKQMMNLACKFR